VPVSSFLFAFCCVVALLTDAYFCLQNNTLLNTVMDVLSVVLPRVLELLDAQSNAAMQGLSERMRYLIAALKFQPMVGSGGNHSLC
jgi:hypothetical protein